MSDWRPNADREALVARAELLANIRSFFRARDVLEVETPLLATTGVTDPSIEPLVVHDTPPRYLQTSPEYAMKRLLAAGSGDIYQVCKAFRAGELGRRHNPEYTLLEWYRLNLTHYQLIREVAELITGILERPGWQIWSWGALFETVLKVDGHCAALEELTQLAEDHVGPLPADLDRDGVLDLLMTHCIEPAIAAWGIVFVVDYPASQAALARAVTRGNQTVGARFEGYVDGIELANGYWESSDADVLRKRFNHDNMLRKTRGQVARPLDERLLAAVAEGLPACAGVALGLDRLLALTLGQDDIQSCLSFGWRRT